MYLRTTGAVFVEAQMSAIQFLQLLDESRGATV